MRSDHPVDASIASRWPHAITITWFSPVRLVKAESCPARTSWKHKRFAARLHAVLVVMVQIVCRVNRPGCLYGVLTSSFEPQRVAAGP